MNHWSDFLGGFCLYWWLRSGWGGRLGLACLLLGSLGLREAQDRLQAHLPHSAHALLVVGAPYSLLLEARGGRRVCCLNAHNTAVESVGCKAVWAIFASL